MVISGRTLGLPRAQELRQARRVEPELRKRHEEDDERRDQAADDEDNEACLEHGGVVVGGGGGVGLVAAVFRRLERLGGVVLADGPRERGVVPQRDLPGQNEGHELRDESLVCVVVMCCVEEKFSIKRMCVI